MWEVGEVVTLRCLSHPWPSGCSLFAILPSLHNDALCTDQHTFSGHRLPHSHLAQSEIGLCPGFLSWSLL